LGNTQRTDEARLGLGFVPGAKLRLPDDGPRFGFVCSTLDCIRGQRGLGNLTDRGALFDDFHERFVPIVEH